MADIEISFGTNAEQIAPQVDKVTTSVGKAEVATARLSKNATNLGSAFAALGGKAGTMGSQLGRAFSVGGTLGAAVAGFVALRKAMEIADYLLDLHKERVRSVAEGYLQMARNVKTANESTQKLGLSAGQTQGATITELVGKGGGGLELANKLTGQGFSAVEAQKATLEAQRKFGDGAEVALQIAARASAAGGGSLSEGLVGLDRSELSNPALASARLLAAHRGQEKFSIGDLESTEKRLRENKLTAGLAETATVNGQRDLNAQGLIPQGVGDARAALADERNPLAKIALDQFNVQSEQLGVLNKIAASQSKIELWYDLVRNGSNNAQTQYSRAVDKAAGAVGAGN